MKTFRMFPIYKILAVLLVLAIVGVIIAVSVWFKTEAGREFKKRRELERRQAEKRDGD